MKSIELLNGNVAVQNIPFPVNSNDRFFSKELTGSINCPKVGNYKLRIKVFCHDSATQISATGLLVSGKITLSEGTCCECGRWEGFDYKLSASSVLITVLSDNL